VALASSSYRVIQTFYWKFHHLYS